jgi:hypothetical protein
MAASSAWVESLANREHRGRFADAPNPISPLAGARHQPRTGLATRLGLGLLGALSLTLAKVAAGPPPASLDRAKDTPDFCQTDPAGKFPGSGGYYCGPVAAANALMQLATSGFPKLRPPAATGKESQILMIHQLAGKEFMNTVGKRGTSPPRLMAGVGKFVEQAGYRITRLEQQGWKERTKQFPVNVEVPSLAWIKQGLATTGGAVMLNVGWYKFNAERTEYERLGGHWVTLVGFDQERSTQEDAPIFIIHDPAPRTGMKPLTQRVRLAALDHGSLLRKLSSGEIRRRDAAGFCTLKDGMKLKSGADTALIDAAVVVVIE